MAGAPVFPQLVGPGSEDFSIYYEGPRGSTGDKWFSDTLAGGGELSVNYETMGGACGLKFQQEYFQLLLTDMKGRPERHVAADVTATDRMCDYQRLVDTDPEFAAAAETAVREDVSESDTNEITKVFNWLASATLGQRTILGTACRGWMTMLLGERMTLPYGSGGCRFPRSKAR